jgi:radical SAM protein with 4Fe4S-binding SPASM domain
MGSLLRNKAQSLWPAQTPRKVWVELTSKCPVDCIFCSRRTLRGAGEHMPYDLFESLVGQISDPRIFCLNYSGESTVYPEIVPAIRLARATGALVELVSALASVPESMLGDLSESGLTRLTVSIHAVDASKYAEIYRYGSFETLRRRLGRFLELCRSSRNAPYVDIAFVAMDRNLAELPALTAFAESLGLRNISVFPVIRRDEIPIQFPGELTPAGTHRREFQARLRSSIDQTRAAFPEVSLTVCDPSFTAGDPCLGEVPGPFPGLLPADGRIYSCEQNPWETAHVLSNGDVVACEVLDKIPLGNLARQPLAEIWHGEAYQHFRERYRRGIVPECRSCPWKQAYRPGPMRAEIIGSRGCSAQLVHGWHDPSNEGHIWSSQQAMAALSPRAGSGILHVTGMLPPGPKDDPNDLVVCCNGNEIGRIENSGREMIPFELDCPVVDGQPEPWSVEFRTRHVYRPSERGVGSSDQRDLGFALVLLASQWPEDPQLAEHQRTSLRWLEYAIRAADLAGGILGGCLRRKRITGASARLEPGLSILIPERDNVEELSASLASVYDAVAHWTEPVEVIVVVNGSPSSNYDSLAASYPAIRWQFHDRPLGFSRAIDAGLRAVEFDWVYLLNSDAVLEPGALEALSRHRDARCFAVASQIVLKDRTRFRDETNWTTLFVEDGLATIHDLIPRSGMPAEGFYAGGGAALFQTRLLRSFLVASVYEPFYWEDVEWGWRARKSGYRVLFCPVSVAHHSQRSTIARHYSSEEIEAVVERNRLLFQLRNFTKASSVERVIEEISRSPRSIAEYFRHPTIIWRIVLGRLWNHAAAISDEEILRFDVSLRNTGPPHTSN